MAKVKANAIPVPKTREGAEELLATIGRLQRTVGDIERRMNDELAEVHERYAQQAQLANDEIEAKFAALHAWAEAHREELLVGKAKTAKLTTGELSWRLSPKSVRVTKAPMVIERLHNLGLARFLRTKEEINKEAILDDPEAVKGVKGINISQKEEFVARPFESELEKAVPAKTTVRSA